MKLTKAFLLLPSVCGFLLGIPDSISAEENGVTQLQRAYQQAIDLAYDPIRRLEKRYTEELEKLKVQKQQTGDLNSVLVIQEEIEGFKNADPKRLEKVPEIRGLRSIFDSNNKKLVEEFRKSQTDILQKASTKFEKMKIEMTKEGKIDLAKQAVDAKDEVQKKIDALEGTSRLGNGEKIAPGLLWSLGSKASFESFMDCEADRKEGKWVLSHPNQKKCYIASDKSFKTPFTAKAKAMTDSNEIRFFLDDKETVIFSWSSNPQQLRLVSPTGGRPVGIQGKGFVEKNQMHDLEIRLTRDRLQAYANGELRGELTGDFSEFEGTVGIGPALGSVVTVEGLEVFELQPE